MPRAPFQVLVLPFLRTPEGIRYAVLKRHDAGYWQGVAGGGEDDETPDATARREAFEEAGIPAGARLIRLDSLTSIPVIHFRDRDLWGPATHVIPEYSFGIEAIVEELHLCDEHTEYQWLNYQDAYEIVRFDSNRTALWELNRRLEQETQ